MKQEVHHERRTHPDPGHSSERQDMAAGQTASLHGGKAMLTFTFVTTKYSTPSQVVPLVMPFPKLSLEPL